MNKSTIWRIGIALSLLLISLALVSPFEDRNLGEYALSQVTSDANSSDHVGHETFSEVLDNIKNQLPAETEVDFKSLRTYGKTNRLDYSAFFKPPSGIAGTVASRLVPFLIKPGIRSGHIKDREEKHKMFQNYYLFQL